MRRPGSGSSVLIEPMVVQPAEQPAIDREQAEALHREIDRLPRSFRRPVVLCYFEGLTLDEAARRLRCPVGTLRSRLARARDKLRRGLTRRGFALPAAVLATALGTKSASASISSPLCDATTKAAIQFAAGQAASPLAASLAREVLRVMLIHKLRFIFVTVLALAAFAAGAGFLTRSMAMKDEPQKSPAASQPPLAAKPNGPAPGRMFVVGRVLSPDGKPVPGAKVMVQARDRQQPDDAARFVEPSTPLLAHAATDGSGRFHLDSPRTSSSRNDRFMAVALAPGYGAGWANLDADAEQPGAEIRLNPEQVIQGHLVDLQGRPAQGVTVSVSFIRRDDPQFGRGEGPSYWWSRLNDRPAWPKPVTTDADGRFTLHGVGRGFKTELCIIDPRFARQVIDLDTDNSPNAKTVTMALRPPQTITGRVTYADTGKPVPQAKLIIAAYEGRNGGLRAYVQTDADGRYRLSSAPGVEFQVQAVPPAGQLYLAGLERFNWPKGAIEHSLDISLARGMLIHGKVTEEGSHHPVAGAVVLYFAHHDSFSRAPSQSKTLADGSFAFAGPLRPGYLAVLAPDQDYRLQEIAGNQFVVGRPDGPRFYAHAFIACDPKPADTTLEVNVVLRRGITLTGRVLAPDGQPARDTWIISPVVLARGPVAWLSWHGDYHGIARNGQFELHGLNPDADVPVHFLEPKLRLGATIRLSGKSAADGTTTVRLQPCGTAKARLIDSKGQPVANYRDPYLITMVLTPGADPASRDPADANRISAEAAPLTRVDSINYEKDPTSDTQGQVVFPALIPGASYRVSPSIRANRMSQPPAKTFTVKPGETLDLGDVVIEKPR
jgi:protocatechuate 3,4-dioxygenase beta subunit